MKFSDWKNVQLQDVVSKLGDGLHGTPKYDENGEYFFINGNNLVDGKVVIKENTKRVSVEEYKKYKKELNDRTILLGINGTIGNVALYENEKCVLGKSACYFNVVNSVDKQFVKYVITNNGFQSYIQRTANGTTIKNVSLKSIREFEFPLPDLKTQTKIASILSSLDDAIELNQQTNKTLEEIAQTLFKEMCVPKGGELPEGWKLQIFENVFDADRGLSYKGAGLAESDAMPMHNLNSVLEGGGYKTKGIKYYNGDYKEKHFVNAGELIIANTEQGHKYMLIGYPAIVPSFYGEKGIFSHHIYRLRPKKSCYLSPDFMYHLLLQQRVREQVIGFANGTTVNMLKIEGLQKPKFAMPPKELAEKFTAIAKANRLQIEQNIVENKTLAELRDLLLPKLMKGEIEILN
jgi:type I restriction enzyme S subunit